MPYTTTFNNANHLSNHIFVILFDNIVEHHRKITVSLAAKRPFHNFNEMVHWVENYLDNLPSGEKHSILAMHPDLAGKMTKRMTPHSVEEQKSLGMESVTVEQKEKLYKLNREYKNRFGFPFVICARDNTIDSTICAMGARINNTYDVELRLGMDEVKKIAIYRIKQVITD